MKKRKHNTVGGGNKTNINGLAFERDTDLLDIFERLDNFKVEIITPEKAAKTRYAKIYKSNEHIGNFYEKDSLYRELFEPEGYNYKEKEYSLLKPDSVFLNIKNKTAYVIEKKFQSGGGSVDEKLQTCDFKKNFYYQPMFQKLGYKTEFYFVLSDWFDSKSKSLVFEYIEKVKCKYFFNFIPFKELGL